MPTTSHSLIVRTYTHEDETSWLRCRALSFLGTQYYDDVKPHRTSLTYPSIELVATLDGAIIGILDIEMDGNRATIDTIATHPEQQGTAVATVLLRTALPVLNNLGIATLDAWTREDAPANGWYLLNGFSEIDRYMHV